MSAENPTIIPATNGAATNGVNGSSHSSSAPLSRPAVSGRPESSNSSSLGTFGVKSGLAQMLKGGVIMDVVNVEQALIAEAAGACAVMALERVPADIRVQGGVARMSDPQMIREICAAVSIPVMVSRTH